MGEVAEDEALLLLAPEHEDTAPTAAKNHSSNAGQDGEPNAEPRLLVFGDVLAFEGEIAVLVGDLGCVLCVDIRGKSHLDARSSGPLRARLTRHWLHAALGTREASGAELLVAAGRPANHRGPHHRCGRWRGRWKR